MPVGSVISEEKHSRRVRWIQHSDGGPTSGVRAASITPRIDRQDRKRAHQGDILPEQTKYRDDGCDVHPSCLTCPLERCRYRGPGVCAVSSLRTATGNDPAPDEGMGIDDLAGKFGVSRRTVFRVIGGADCRHGGCRRCACSRRTTRNTRRSRSGGRRPPRRRRTVRNVIQSTIQMAGYLALTAAAIAAIVGYVP